MRLAVHIRSVKWARGAERTVAALARGLGARGHRVDLLVEEREGWLLDELSRGAHAPRVVELACDPASLRARWRARAIGLGALLASAPGALRGRPPEAAGSPGPLLPLARLALSSAAQVAALRDYVEREQPDAVLSFLNYPSFAMLLAASRCRAPTRFFASVRNHVSTSSARARSRWNRSVPVLMRALLPRADGIAVPSRGVADDVMKICGVTRDRVRVIANPVVRDELAALARAPSGHPWLDARTAPAVPVVLGVGKLKPQKDFATLLRAFAELRRERPARLLLLGEGDERDELLALAGELGVREDTDLPGEVRNPHAFFARAGVYVLSSAWEGLPNTLIEALACGCPVVATDCPSGPAEIVKDPALGALVPVGEPAAMARAIAAVLDAPPPRERLVAAAAPFSLEAALAGYEALLEGRAAPE